MAGKQDIETRVAALADLSRDNLAALWRKDFGTAPPKGVHRELLIRSAAFHLQQKHLGGRSGEAKRLLKAAMRQTAKTMAEGRDHRAGIASATIEGDSSNLAASNERLGGASPIDLTGLVVTAPRHGKPPVEQRSPGPGARLIRDWNGNSHVVDVVEGGYIYTGTRYRSLSKIAREITGTNWSGPRFFGL